MRLSAERARERLVAHDHGVLATVHPVRGVDAVPVVPAEQLQATFEARELLLAMLGALYRPTQQFAPAS